MENKLYYTKHFVMLSVLFVLGNACITAPVKTADKYNFFVFLVSCVIGVIFAFTGYFIPVNKLTLIPIYLLCFFTLGDSLISFIKFISDNLLPDTSRFFILLPFVLILVYLGFKRTDTLFKFSLICGFLSAVVIVFFFLATFKDFDFENIYIKKLPDLDKLYFQIGFYFRSLIIPAALLGVFARAEGIKKKTLLCGLGLGFLCLAVTILNSVLLFGIEFSGALKYPYSSAGSTVTFGNLFTRLDGFLYFVYSATCTVKCTLAIFTAKKSVLMLKNYI